MSEMQLLGTKNYTMLSCPKSNCLGTSQNDARGSWTCNITSSNFATGLIGHIVKKLQIRLLPWVIISTALHIIARKWHIIATVLVNEHFFLRQQPERPENIPNTTKTPADITGIRGWTTDIWHRAFRNSERKRKDNSTEALKSWENKVIKEIWK